MAANPALFKKASAAAIRLAATEREVDAARAEYHAIVRRVHLAGSSLREIAQALGLSHQRVQQMVEGAGGTWWRRIWRSRTAKSDLACTFCERKAIEVTRLIAGPDVFICGDCIAQAPNDGPLAWAPAESRSRCGFCRKQAGPGRPLLRAARANICQACLETCRQILIDSAE